MRIDELFANDVPLSRQCPKFVYIALATCILACIFVYAVLISTRWQCMSSESTGSILLWFDLEYFVWMCCIFPKQTSTKSIALFLRWLRIIPTVNIWLHFIYFTFVNGKKGCILLQPSQMTGISHEFVRESQRIVGKRMTNLRSESRIYELRMDEWKRLTNYECSRILFMFAAALVYITIIG